MGQTSRKRPWLAALLAFVYPGLGHVYIREWLRALLWFGLMIATASFVIPEQAVQTADLSIAALSRASEQLSLEAAFTVLFITALSMIDAYRLAATKNQAVKAVVEGTRCPACGRDVDPELNFCHWCTTELPPTLSDDVN
ncbi:zinc ribbon domain-containing protein [Haladaptatus sp. DJG-WS-42]|uniref:zinc ribbon domain-containing protein n=1 Tax=Haladaptatus sp. DJG-WS-42 TaxID=3120516 RepID=UPI0030D15E51